MVGWFGSMVLVVVWVVARIGGWVVAVVVEIRLLLLWVDRYGGLVVVVVVVVVVFFFFFFFFLKSKLWWWSFGC